LAAISAYLKQFATTYRDASAEAPNRFKGAVAEEQAVDPSTGRRIGNNLATILAVSPQCDYNAPALSP
jgi:hypothetical protein